MSARPTDEQRVAELYRVICEAEERVRALGLTRETFIRADDPLGRAVADGMFMCVFRAAEEAGRMGDETRARHSDIPWRAISGMRNIFAHDYGRLDRDAVWTSIERDLPRLKVFCQAFAAEHGMEL